MATLAELKGRINLVADQLSELYKKAERTADEESTMDTLLAEFNDLGPQIERLGSFEAVLKNRSQSAGRVAGIEGMAGQEGEGPGGRTIIEPTSLTDKFYAEIVQPFIKAGGLSNNGPETSLAMALGGFAKRGSVLYEAFSGEHGIGPQERYTLIRSGGQPEYLVPPQVQSGIYRGIDNDLTVRSVLINGRTTSDTIYFLRELAYTNAAAETAEATTFDVSALGSSGRKPESALTFEQASAPVVTIAHWVPVTRQALADAAQLQTYIEGRLIFGVNERLNEQALIGDGTGANMTGILETAGIQEPTFGDTANTGTQLENFDRIARSRTLVRTDGLARPTFVIVNPADMEVLLTTADDTNNYISGGPWGSALQRTVWGLPVVEETAMPEGEFLVGDGSMAAIWDREDANILVGTINDQLVRNMLTILAELRAALTVFRPAAFVHGTFV